MLVSGAAVVGGAIVAGCCAFEIYCMQSRRRQGLNQVEFLCAVSVLDWRYGCSMAFVLSVLGKRWRSWVDDSDADSDSFFSKRNAHTEFLNILSLESYAVIHSDQAFIVYITQINISPRTLFHATRLIPSLPHLKIYNPTTHRSRLQVRQVCRSGQIYNRRFRKPASVLNTKVKDTGLV